MTLTIERGVMKTSAIKDTLELYDIPTDSYMQAVDHVSNEANISEGIYIRRSTELTGVTRSFEDDRKYRYFYLYCVQEGVRAIIDSEDEIDLDVKANDKMEQFFERCDWVLRVYEKKQAELGKDGKPKPKRGAKKAMAKALYAKHKDEDLSRKQWIELLVKEADMTKAGASTYYSNLKKGQL